MTENRRRSLDNTEAVIAVAVDVSKAFDSNNHSLLLVKLKAYGFSSSALKLMSSYLLGCRQHVKVQGLCSSYQDIKKGVQPGSLLGPLLFNIFINHLSIFVPYRSLRLYADDSTGYLSDTSPSVVKFVMNSELSLSSWFDDNCLLIDIDKTQALPIGSCTYDYDLVLNDVKTETQESIKILCITLDRVLSFKKTYCTSA